MGTRHARTQADDLLRMAEHRRSMHALRRAAAKAASEGVTTAAARPVAGDVPDNVTCLADVRARRTEHPAGTAHAN